MIAIALTFPAGRFHATPWGRHVNEGATEWPPSPWRILRSIVATWKRKLDDRITTEQMRPILVALTDVPSFFLPPAATGHTRHYMPLRFPDQGDRTKVFDAFVALRKSDRLRKSDLLSLWPNTLLDSAAREVLHLVLTHLGSLGRAESWCEASLLEDTDAGAVVANCTPLNGEVPGRGTEIVRLLCAHRTAAFDNAHTPKIKTAAGGKKAKGETRPLYDPDWHLCLETSELHDKRWSDPPGSLWVRYVRRSDCFAVRSATHAAHVTRREPPQVVRFSLDSSVLPLLQETIKIAERSRSALMSLFGKYWPAADGTRGRTPVFSGKSEDGTPLKDHSHAFFLPTDEDGDGRLDHLTVYASGGFGDKELKAIDKLSAIRRDEGQSPLRVLQLALGRASEVTSGPLATAQAWVSTTPFLASRHPKRRGLKRDRAELLAFPPDFVRRGSV